MASTGGRSSVLIIVLVFGALFSMLYFAMPTTEQTPAVVVDVKILEGSTLETSEQYLEPEVIRVVIGVNNTVRWINEDTVPHTVTSDEGYRDAYSGVFDSRERSEDEGGPFVMPGEEFEFLFTKIGEYPYHCEPHPWMKGMINVVENFA